MSLLKIIGQSQNCFNNICSAQYGNMFESDKCDWHNDTFSYVFACLHCNNGRIDHLYY